MNGRGKASTRSWSECPSGQADQHIPRGAHSHAMPWSRQCGDRSTTWGNMKPRVWCSLSRSTAARDPRARRQHLRAWQRDPQSPFEVAQRDKLYSAPRRFRTGPHGVFMPVGYRTRTTQAMEGRRRSSGLSAMSAARSAGAVAHPRGGRTMSDLRRNTPPDRGTYPASCRLQLGYRPETLGGRMASRRTGI